MKLWGLVCRLFVRYIDDIRIYTHIIKPGWYWTELGWIFDDKTPDDRDPVTRTLQELNKSFDSVINFLNFTTESEHEFETGYLPTLDMETKVDDRGMIKYRFFRKPTCNNIVIQNGTSLPRNTIFSSLRQEVIRRLSNTSADADIKLKIRILEDFIQLMRNSKHEFSFIKAVILQGITKYEYMKWRNSLPKDDKKYLPLHRMRSFNSHERVLLKYANCMIWFTEEKLGDPYRQEWKKGIRKSGDKCWRKPRNANGSGKKCIANKNGVNKLHKKDGKDITSMTTTTIFVPPSHGSKLYKFVVEKEKYLNKGIRWRSKFLEQPGKSLLSQFITLFPMNDGCPKMDQCTICDGQGTKCNSKGV